MRLSQPGKYLDTNAGKTASSALIIGRPPSAFPPRQNPSPEFSKNLGLGHKSTSFFSIVFFSYGNDFGFAEVFAFFPLSSFILLSFSSTAFPTFTYLSTVHACDDFILFHLDNRITAHGGAPLNRVRVFQPHRNMIFSRL
jgi:hypothetical protein